MLASRHLAFRVVTLAVLMLQAFGVTGCDKCSKSNSGAVGGQLMTRTNAQGQKLANGTVNANGSTGSDAPVMVEPPKPFGPSSFNLPDEGGATAAPETSTVLPGSNANSLWKEKFLRSNFAEAEQAFRDGTMTQEELDLSEARHNGMLSALRARPDGISDQEVEQRMQLAREWAARADDSFLRTRGQKDLAYWTARQEMLAGR